MEFHSAFHTEIPASTEPAVLAERDCGCGILWELNIPKVGFSAFPCHPEWEFLGVLEGTEKAKPFLGQERSGLGGAATQAPLPKGWGANPRDVRESGSILHHGSFVFSICPPPSLQAAQGTSSAGVCNIPLIPVVITELSITSQREFLP